MHIDWTKILHLKDLPHLSLMKAPLLVYNFGSPLVYSHMPLNLLQGKILIDWDIKTIKWELECHLNSENVH